VASFLVVICLIYFPNDADAAQCNETAAIQCNATLASYFKKDSVQAEEDINRVCGNMKVISKCVRSIKCSKQISDVEKNSWRGVQKGFIYVCNDQSAKRAIIIVAEAKTPERKIEEAKCAKSFEDAVKSHGADPAAVCRNINKLLDCTMDTVKTFELKVKKVVHKFMYKYFTPTASSLKCALKKVSQHLKS